MTTQVITLIDNAGAGDGEWKEWLGGEGEFTAVGTFGGSGEIKLQYMGPKATAVDVGTDCTLAANGGGVFALGPGFLRAVVADCTGASAVVKGLG